jgi:PIN domain nuclease of toxin-antitoxin system
MRLLLDTCAILWLADDQVRLTPTVVAAIGGNAPSLFVSAISAFEISLKHHKGKLTLPMEPHHWWSLALASHGLRVLPVSDTIALASTALPPLHHEPCDRIIIATASEFECRIVTSDALIGQYAEATVLW